MYKGKTKSGFKYHITDDSINNFELLEALTNLRSDQLELPRVVSLLLGNEQKTALFNHVRAEAGNVPIDRVEKEVMEIFGAVKEAKKSSSSPE